MPAQFVNEILLIIGAAFVGGFVARSISLPPVLGYITSGIVFGVIGKHYLSSYESFVSLSEIGVSLLLFTLGFEMSFDKLKKIDKKVLFTGVAQVLITAIVFYPALVFLNFDWQVALLFALLFSFSSTAVIVKVLEEKGFLNTFPGNNVFVFLLIQDLFVVPVIFLVPLLFSEQAITVSSLYSFLSSAVKPLVVFLSIFLFSKLFLSRFLGILFRYPIHELTILATIFVAALSIGLFQSVGLPQSIAAFLAGMLISEQGKNLAVLSEIRPFRDIFLVFFFVLTGMLIDFSYLVSHLPEILGLTMLVLVLKFIFIYFTLRNVAYTHVAALFTASYLANVGEFAPVIGQMIFSQGFITDETYNTLLSVFMISLLFIPFSLTTLKDVLEKLFNTKLLRVKVEADPSMARSLSKKSYDNHVVICGHGRVGSEVRKILDKDEIPYLVIDFNKNVITELSADNKIALYGDPTDYEVLLSAAIHRARALVIAVPDSISQKKIVSEALSINPELYIICRSHTEEQRQELLSLGAHMIVIPEHEAGVKIGSEVAKVFEGGRTRKK